MTNGLVVRSGLMAALLFLYLAPAHGEPRPVRKSDILVAAPQWHTGQWWRVRVPQLIGSPMRQDWHDAPTDYAVYRYHVVGKRTLTFEDQDSREHIGQAVPPEECWLVIITEEGASRLGGPASYHLYFRSADLSLREIAEPRRRQGTDFEYSSTRINDDDQAKPVVMVVPGSYRSDFGPPILDWPGFPLMAETPSPDRVRAVNKIVTRFDGTAATGAQVILGSGTDTTRQVWLPGLPWWVSADRNGLQKSSLIETSDRRLPEK